MRCLHCGLDIPAEAIEAAGNDGRFRCPHCAAEHVRREIARRADGRPEYGVRLWGHPTRFRRRPTP